MALSVGAVAVNTTTGGEIKTGLAAAIYDSILAEAGGNLEGNGPLHHLPRALGAGGPENVEARLSRASVARFSNGLALAIVGYLSTNGYP